MGIYSSSYFIVPMNQKTGRGNSNGLAAALFK
jgi:hypothetical protein